MAIRKSGWYRQKLPLFAQKVPLRLTGWLNGSTFISPASASGYTGAFARSGCAFLI